MKVYISKSNKGNMDAIIMAREYCRNQNYEVLEYVGGQYDPELIKSAELIMIVPMTAIENNQFIVGKGQWSESGIEGITTKVFDATKKLNVNIKERKLIDITHFQNTGLIIVE